MKATLGKGRLLGNSLTVFGTNEARENNSSSSILCMRLGLISAAGGGGGGGSGGSVDGSGGGGDGVDCCCSEVGCNNINGGACSDTFDIILAFNKNRKLLK
ncbi:hypothetical protein TorRG33x02_047970 [Trema orientale]|uniref:Uncharacterized protein n=1 Tax=Trema orientale TaxID=63057 RepID=A0A2P5FN97_TREOI|nr:hypothetical protein TorRG33x02_047970 [Trema orientale]